MLLVSLDCPFLIAPSVFSNIYLNSDGIKSTNIKQSEHSPLILTKLTEHKEKTTTCDVRNPDPGLGEEQTCPRDNRLMGPQHSHLDNWISNSNTYINK